MIKRNKNQLKRIINKYKLGIKKNCYDCMGYQKKTDCKLEKCSLFAFRPWAKNNQNLKEK